MNNELEIYAPIKDFPNYLVTSHGRVLSLKDNHGKDRIKELKQIKYKSGYLHVNLGECKKDGFSYSCISSCCNNKLKTHKGYEWYYTDVYFYKNKKKESDL